MQSKPNIEQTNKPTTKTLHKQNGSKTHPKVPTATNQQPSNLKQINKLQAVDQQTRKHKPHKHKRTTTHQIDPTSITTQKQRKAQRKAPNRPNQHKQHPKPSNKITNQPTYVNIAINKAKSTAN